MQYVKLLLQGRCLLLGLLLVLNCFHSVRASTDPLAINQMVADWQRAKEYTKEYLDAMPEDGISYKPAQDMRSFAEQMLHLAGGNFMIASKASGKANPYEGKNLEKMDEYKNKAALSKIVMESYDYVINNLKSMKESQFGEKVNIFNFEVTKEAAFHKVFEHQTHHRGQTTVYLRMRGIKPPAEKLF